MKRTCKAWLVAALFSVSATANSDEAFPHTTEDQPYSDVIELNEEGLFSVDELDLQNDRPEPPRPPPPRNPPNPPRYPPSPRPEPPRPRPPRPNPPRFPDYPTPPRYPQPPGYTRYIRCDSINGKYRECWLGPRAVSQVWLVRTHSRAVCRRGYSYGVHLRSIWVSRGCRATFAVRSYYNHYIEDLALDEEETLPSTFNEVSDDDADMTAPRKPLPPANPSPTPPQTPEPDQRDRHPRRPPDVAPTPPQRPPGSTRPVQYIRCDSGRWWGKRQCHFYPSAAHVQLVSVHSKRKCIFDKSYGYTSSFIWVRLGCQATFAIYR